MKDNFENETPRQDAAMDGERAITRRQMGRKMSRYARYTAPVIATLALTQPAWASHDSGNQKSEA